MTEQQKELKIKKLFLIPPAQSGRPITRKLSVQPEEFNEEMGNLPRSLVRILWKQAEEIISHDAIK